MTAFRSHHSGMHLAASAPHAPAVPGVASVAPAAASVHQFHELPLMLQFLLHHSEEMHRVRHGLLMVSLARCTPPLEHVIRSAAEAGAMLSTAGGGPATAQGSATM